MLVFRNWPPYIRPHLTRRGADRDRHERGLGCGGRRRADNERRGGVRRSRVVLTPQCWRQVGDDASHHADDGDTAWTPRRARINRKAIAQGRPECSRSPVCSCAAFLLLHIAHDTAGAARTRLSLRPLLRVALRLQFGARMKLQTSGEKPSREREVMSQRHCEERSDEAIQSSLVSLDCFAEPVIGRAFARPVGSQ